IRSSWLIRDERKKSSSRMAYCPVSSRYLLNSLLTVLTSEEWFDWEKFCSAPNRMRRPDRSRKRWLTAASLSEIGQQITSDVAAFGCVAGDLSPMVEKTMSRTMFCPYW